MYFGDFNYCFPYLPSKGRRETDKLYLYGVKAPIMLAHSFCIFVSNMVKKPPDPRSDECS